MISVPTYRGGNWGFWKQRGPGHTAGKRWNLRYTAAVCLRPAPTGPLDGLFPALPCLPSGL